MLGALRKTGGVARRAARGAAALAGQSKRAMSGVMDEYGSMCFVGAVADKVSRMCLVVWNSIPAPHAALFGGSDLWLSVSSTSRSTACLLLTLRTRRGSTQSPTRVSSPPGKLPLAVGAASLLLTPPPTTRALRCISRDRVW